MPHAKTARSFVYTRLVVTPEGQVLKMSSGFNGEGLVVTDLAGNPITDERYTGNNSYQNLCEFWPLSYALGLHRRGIYLAPESLLHGSSHVQGVNLGNEAKENWFLLVRRNYFIGYDTRAAVALAFATGKGSRLRGPSRSHSQARCGASSFTPE